MRLRAAVATILLVACATSTQHSGIDRASFDAHVPPCADFYESVNGTWLATHPIPSDESSWGIASAPVKNVQTTLRTILEQARGTKIGSFYATCMDESAIDAGGLGPIQPELARIATQSPTDSIADLQLLAVSAPFAFGSAEDAKDSSRDIAVLAQRGLGLPDPSDYDNGQRRADYQQHVAEMLRLAQIPGDAAQIVELETRLAHASLTRAQRRDPNATYHLTRVEQLPPVLDWPHFFQRLGLPNLREVNVEEPQFIEALKDIPPGSWRAYLSWHLLREVAPWMPRTIAAEHQRFEAQLNGNAKEPERWQRCVSVTDSYLGEELGRAYVAHKFDERSRQRVDQMVRNIIAAMHDVLETADWMSDATRAEGLKKLAAMRWKIGYPERWRDDSSLKIIDAPFATNVLAADAFLERLDLDKIGKPADRNAWSMSPQTWNAYNNYGRNEIVFPAAILQWPRFDARLDDAFNYGSIGGVIGHELTHGFDDSGRQYDAAGNVRDWWTADDARRFDERAACVMRQYESYEAAPGLHHIGKLIAGESIADLSGLEIAWRAWQKSLVGKPAPVIDGFTGEQRFFLAFAQARAINVRPELLERLIRTDTHPVARLRVNGTVANMPQFAAAFGCKSGDPLVRSDRCRVW
jgi:predicted metalloendopeptidase